GSRTTASAQRFAQRHAVEHAFGSYDQLTVEADVDAVYIATTNNQHYANAMSCLRHQRAVLCEKPLTLSAEQTRELVDTARTLGVLLVEAMWMRFQPFVPVLDDIIASGAVGDINHVEASFSFLAERGATNRWFGPYLGGGSLLDIGVYPLTLAYHLFGKPLATQATATLASTGVDEQTAICSQHSGGALSVLTSSFVAATAAEATIAGPGGRIRLQSPFHHCDTILVETSGSSAVMRYDTSYAGDGLECEIAEVHRCLRESLLESPLMPHADSIAIAEWTTQLLTQIGVRY
ncbi:MAG: Gfo/Idh/MocA family protein, partial [Gammaproteobacteria bacterium]